ncbi:MAG: type II toxin-antitoxin system HipA family toxin [Oligoflexia bacterium]|nr:type II toxin-antitoxin system HipA family toxin [Oligoflexia bacterium]
MTESGKKQAYVFITLPGQSAAVPAGKITLTSLAPGAPSEFIYGKKYLENKNAIAFDPVHLPLSEKKYLSNIPGLFGVIRDASPDSWGRFIIEKRAQNLAISEIDYLLLSSGERAGALTFAENLEYTCPDKIFGHSIHNLDELINAIAELSSGNIPYKNSMANLMQFGSSMGGARPKIIIEDNNELWLAKFNRSDDKMNFCRIEYANMLLAKKCEINIPEVKLINSNDKDIYMIKRFDRKKNIQQNKYYKTHFISALTLTGRTEIESGKSSYQEIAGIIRQVCAEPAKQLEELFRRMVFNVLCLNADDHLKNHGFLYYKPGYKLSPAYDIVPMPQMSFTKSLSLNIGKFGKTASFKNLLSDSGAFGMEQHRAENIIKELYEATREWKKHYKDCGVSGQDIILVSNCFERNYNND